ncbi:hypothetical protein VTN96DRAFT_2813 [Rasamsonia emersonii]
MKILAITAAFLGGMFETAVPDPIPCCAALSSTALQSKVFYPGSTPYQRSVESYFAVNAQLEPSCIVQPLSAEDVSIAVSTLVQNSDLEPCQFAVRSGGHTTWAGAADIPPGVTIDLSMMNPTTYHSENSTASILPGARWKSVYQTLDAFGVAVPGGRAGPVGVGGFTIGGGNSFFAARYGFVCDNVVNFELVLANGSIINANSQTNSDLFKALKGGSNNFGIVTKIDLSAFPQGDLWGGVVRYDNSTSTRAQLVPAIVNFTNHVEDDPFASLITFWQYSSALGANVFINALEYTKPVVNPRADDGVGTSVWFSATLSHIDIPRYARAIHADNEFIYLDYSDKWQNPLRSYGAKNLAFLRKVAEKYDPSGVFQRLVPGRFKVTGA